MKEKGDLDNMNNEKPPFESTIKKTKPFQEEEFKIIKDANLDAEKIKFIQERLYRMIDYTVKRQDWYSDQCQRLLQIGLGLLASGVAIIALFTKVDNLPQISMILGWLVGISIFITGFVLVLIFNSELAGDHPYRKVVDITSWYFAYHFPDNLSQKLNKDPEIAKTQIDQEASYIRSYYSKFLSKANEKFGFLREDIEQVTILLLLQKYKYQQTRRMRRDLSIGLTVAAIFLFLFFVSILFFPDTSLYQVNLSSTSTATATITSTFLPQLTPTSTNVISISPTSSPRSTPTKFIIEKDPQIVITDTSQP